MKAAKFYLLSSLVVQDQYLLKTFNDKDFYILRWRFNSPIKENEWHESSIHNHIKSYKLNEIRYPPQKVVKPLSLKETLIILL